MSFTRFHYDDNRNLKQLQELTDQGKWILNTPGFGSIPYYYKDPHIRLEKWGGNLSTDVVDISSQMQGRNTKQSKYGNVIDKCSNYKTIKTKDVDPFTNETRYTHPAFMYRNPEYTHWNILHFNPQVHIHDNTHISSRIIQKNNFVPKYIWKH